MAGEREYTIVFRRTVTQTATYQVKALDKKDAEQRAEEILEARGTDLGWDSVKGAIEITGGPSL